MAKFSSDFALNIPQQFKTKIPLKPVKDVSVNDVRVNPNNTLFFKTESKEYFQRLEEDIRKRGILVPLIAKKDGTLLAGHNRLAIAKQIGLPLVPVQFVDEDKYDISPEAEREFVVKDNLLRRQFNAQEWIEVYRQLYPNFDERIQERKAGRPAKEATSVVSNEASKEQTQSKKIKNGSSVTISQEPSAKSVTKKMVPEEPFPTDADADKPLTAQRIAKDTNQTVSAVKKQLWKHKTEVQKKLHGGDTKQNATNEEQAVTLDAALLKTMEKNLLRIESAMESANELTRKEALKKLRAFMKKIS
jgi:ParB-like chromosome segregation protein Spo0J